MTKPTEVTITKEDVELAIKSYKLAVKWTKHCPMWYALKRLGVDGIFEVGGNTIYKDEKKLASFKPPLPLELCFANGWGLCLADNYKMPSFAIKWLKELS